MAWCFGGCVWGESLGGESRRPCHFHENGKRLLSFSVMAKADEERKKGSELGCTRHWSSRGQVTRRGMGYMVDEGWS